MFFIIVIGIFFVSFVWALLALWLELKKSHRTQVVSTELAKGRVIFDSQAHQTTPIDTFSREKTEQTLP